ncbi:hypothetical protein [Halocynthiibacter namhaensis]|uniref:hypothetical protein n=1 Tax=Halocynthiibacter namhaensis TaxID=1290553 RepID=UPI00057937BE|nr:hypothetical protein [Halocynthiibacter namhaensis]
MAIENGENITGLKLWLDGGNVLAGGWGDLCVALRDPAGGNDPEGWEFWIDFYEGQLSGHPLPLELIKDIAISGDIDWKSDNASINAAIGAIYRRFKKAASHTVERSQTC